MALDRNTKIELLKTLERFEGSIMEQIAQRDRLFNTTFNTFNVLVRMIQKKGIEAGWFKDEAEFAAIFAADLDELMAEHKAHQDAEMERMRAEQAAGGEATPMAPAPSDTMRQLGEVVERKLVLVKGEG